MGESKCSYALSEISYFYNLEKPGKFHVPNRILRDTGTKFFKCIQSEMSRKIGTNRTPDYTSNLCENSIFLFLTADLTENAQIHTIYSVLLPIRTVASTVAGTCKDCGRTFRCYSNPPSQYFFQLHE